MLPNAPLRTDRLLLRRPRLSDIPDLFRIFGDAEAMRYTTHFASLRDWRRHVVGHECQRRKLGYGPWTVLESSTGRIIGFGGLYDDPFDPGWGMEVAYWFAPSSWGKGYATELTRFCLIVAHDTLGRDEVRAFARPENAASVRVLEKAGFRRDRFVPSLERHLYAWRAEEKAGGHF